MLHKEFWGLLFLAFVGWIFIVPNPNQRIENFCKPVGWTGNVGTSVTALIVPTQQASVQRWFDKFEYSCRYMTWRLMYQAEYNKAMGINPDGQATPQTAPQAPAAKNVASSSPAEGTPAK